MLHGAVAGGPLESGALLPQHAGDQPTEEGGEHPGATPGDIDDERVAGALAGGLEQVPPGHPQAEPAGLPGGLWAQVSSPELRPSVRLFFEVFALATRGAPGTAQLLDGLTTSWLDEAVEVATRMGLNADRAAMRLGVAVSRGLLLDLLAGAPKEEVDAAYELFAQLYEGRA